MQVRFSLLLVAVTLGCSSSPAAPASGADAAADAPLADTSVVDSGKPYAPANLRSFESNAEGIGDNCKIVAFVKAKAILGQANANWATLRPQVQAAGAGAALIKQADDLLAKLALDLGTSPDQRACETDANALSLTVPDMFDFYTFNVPSDVLRGDGVFRQLQIDGEYLDWANAPKDLATTKALWVKLKPVVAAQAPTRLDIPGAATVVADTDKTIGDCDTAVTAKDSIGLQTAGQAGLDEIDVSETIFK